jgi:3-methyladenine DNA glycosylase/8-oxoguanine DNA glycosylase
VHEPGGGEGSYDAGMAAREGAASRRRLRADGPVDLRLVLRPLQRGAHDPCMRVVSATAAWRASHTPGGSVTVHLGVDRPAGDVEVTAWGPGAAWALEHATGLAGLDDDPEQLATDHPLVRAWQRQRPGLRLVAARAVYDVALQTVLEQRVTGVESRRAWHALVSRHGAPAPGPEPVAGLGLRVPPPPAVVAALADAERHRLGVETSRGRTLSLVAGEDARLQRACDRRDGSLGRRLRTLPGVGPWTAALVTHLVEGDPDAVPVGDYHICHDVTYAFTGEPRGSDERMLELLAPFAGQRGRVVRLALAAVGHRPRVAPRAVIPDRIRAEARAARRRPGTGRVR